MPDQKPKVTLGYSQSKKQYCVERIEGTRTTVPFGTGDFANLARVGKWLSDAETNLLGLEANLTIWRYVCRLGT